jgi:hypothetical protein
MKNKIKKLLDKIQGFVNQIEEYNEYLNENSYNGELSYNVKAYDWIGESDIRKLKCFDILNKNSRDRVLEEFNDDRLNDIYYHTIDNERENFIDSITYNVSPYSYLLDAKEISFQGRQGGHLCLGSISSFEAELNDVGLCDYPFYSWSGVFSIPDDIDQCITELKEHFGVTTQKKVYDLLKVDIVKEFEPYCKDLEKKLLSFAELETDIEGHKKFFKDTLIGQLEFEIEQFIDDEYSYEQSIELAEQGDYSQLDSILSIEKDMIKTNQKVQVPLKAAILAIQEIEKGTDVIGSKISHYTIEAIEKREKDTYVKIGCHLFSVNQTKLQLHI